jgi:alcohol dehydrogenase
MQCQLGAWLSVYGTGNVGVGLSHGLGHQLGARFGMIHGVTSACMLPHVMELNAAATGPQLRRIGEVFGAASTDTDAAAGALAVSGMHEFVAALEPLGVPHTLAAAGARREELSAVASEALRDMAVAANPRPLEHEDILRLLDSAWNPEPDRLG